MAAIEVVRGTELAPADGTAGIVRGRAFESEALVVSRSRIAAGTISAWHHHGTRHLYGFLVSGRLRFEYGPAGADSVEIRPGDFFHIGPGLVHRDVNPDQMEPAVVVNVTAGRGPTVVNVTGPERSRGSAG